MASGILVGAASFDVSAGAVGAISWRAVDGEHLRLAPWFFLARWWGDGPGAFGELAVGAAFEGSWQWGEVYASVPMFAELYGEDAFDGEAIAWALRTGEAGVMVHLGESNAVGAGWERSFPVVRYRWRADRVAFGADVGAGRVGYRPEIVSAIARTWLQWSPRSRTRRR